jgi:hypothetical protein
MGIRARQVSLGGVKVIGDNYLEAHGAQGVNPFFKGLAFERSGWRSDPDDGSGTQPRRFDWPPAYVPAADQDGGAHRWLLS